jgi:2-keto-3-deoxy-L-rhamnonate aldolase RhmA
MIRELEKARRFKSRLRGGEACIGAQLALSDPAVAEIFGRAGYDWLVVDSEHAANNNLTVRNMLQAAAHTSAVLLARPLRLDVDEIRHYLDLGSPGVLCPFINTGEEARRLVQACRYPPAGIRGYGPRRAGVYGFDADEYFDRANDDVICIPIIESKAGVQNIEAIVSVDGIDGIVIGPMDLSISLGIFKQFEHPAYLNAVEQVKAACQKHKKAMGTACSSYEHALHCMAQGYSLLLVGGDDQFMVAEARRWIESLRKKEIKSR